MFEVAFEGERLTDKTALRWPLAVDVPKLFVSRLRAASLRIWPEEVTATDLVGVENRSERNAFAKP